MHPAYWVPGWMLCLFGCKVNIWWNRINMVRKNYGKLGFPLVLLIRTSFGGPYKRDALYRVVRVKVILLSSENLA